jgi:hypothetical protein
MHIALESEKRLSVPFRNAVFRGIVATLARVFNSCFTAKGGFPVLARSSSQLAASACI